MSDLEHQTGATSSSSSSSSSSFDIPASHFLSVFNSRRRAESQSSSRSRKRREESDIMGADGISADDISSDDQAGMSNSTPLAAFQRQRRREGGGEEGGGMTPPESPSKRLRPRHSPFSSPRNHRRDYVTPMDTEPSDRTSPQASRHQHRPLVFQRQGKSPCPDDCRCSDREIEMGRCACALESESESENGSSRSSRPERREIPNAKEVQVKLNWQRRERERPSEHGLAEGSTRSSSSMSTLAPVPERMEDHHGSSARRPRVRNATFTFSPLQPLAIEDGDEEPDARRKRRREERDRLIRQRIEEKRKARAREGASLAAVIPTSSTRALQPNVTEQQSARRERTFEEEIGRLRKLSKPPSVNSIAAFAAQVSPSKRKAQSGITIARPLNNEDEGGEEASVVAKSMEASPTKTLKQVLLRENASAKISQAPMASAEEGSSTTSLATFQHPSPRLLVVHRQDEPSTPMSLTSVKVGTNSTADAQCEEVSVAASTPANRTGIFLKTPNASSRDSANASTSRKSVRFSPQTDVVEALRTDSTVSSASDSVGSGKRRIAREGTEETTSESSDDEDAVEDWSQQELHHIKDHQSETVEAPSPALASTPIRLPPGAFGSPFALGRLPKAERVDSPSFSVFTLRPHAKRTGTPQTSLRTRPLPPETPIPPGGLRLAKDIIPHPLGVSQASNVTPVRGSSNFLQDKQGVTNVLGERGLPPSYSAIATSPTSSPDFSASRSNSVDSGLDELPVKLNGARTDSVEPDVSQQPRQSTPPSMSVSSSEMRRGIGKRKSLADSVPWTHIEDLGGIASPPASRAATPKTADTLEGDDSIRATLAKVLGALSRPDPALDWPLAMHDHKPENLLQASSASMREAKEAGDRLLEIKIEEDIARERLARRAAVDLKQTARLKDAQRQVWSKVISLAGLRSVPGIDPQWSRRWNISSTVFWIAIQVLILWLALLAIQHGSDHLHRTVYYDAFYPHLYDSTHPDAILTSLREPQRYKGALWVRTDGDGWNRPLGGHRASWLGASSGQVSFLNRWIGRTMVPQDSPRSAGFEYHSWSALLTSLRDFPRLLALSVIADEGEGKGQMGSASSSYLVPV